MQQPTCAAHNGTYVCTKPNAHPGRHETTRRVLDSQNVVVKVRVFRWNDAYGQISITERKV